MTERVTDDGFETTFVVRTPRAEAWERLAAAEAPIEGLLTPRPGQWWISGVEAPADELEVRHGELLRARKAVEPCKGTEIVIAMEDEDTGTRITFVETGFGPGFSQARPWLAAGWYSIQADLEVFFGRGVSLGRHLTRWGSIGCDVSETGEGLVVGEVRPDHAVSIWQRSEPRLATFDRMPSEQAADQLRFTPYPFEDVGWLCTQAAAALFVYSSDYPHAEGGRDPLGRFERSLRGSPPATEVSFFAESAAAWLGRWTGSPPVVPRRRRRLTCQIDVDPPARRHLASALGQDAPRADGLR